MSNSLIKSRAVAAALSALLAGSGCAQTQLNASGDASAEAFSEVPRILAAAPASASDPEAELLFSLLAAELAVQAGDYDQASEYYLGAARLSRDAAVAERATRVALFARQPGRALTAAERWQELAPESLDVMQTVAVLLVGEGSDEAAADQLQRLIGVVGPEEGFRLSASLLTQAEDRDAALRTLTRLVEANPTESAGWQALGEFALLMEDHEGARAAARAGLERFPDAVPLRLILARAAAELDDPEAALEALAAAVETHPDRRDVRLAYARALLDVEDFERVQPEFDRLLALAPDDAELLLTTALLSLEAGRFEIARDYLQRLLRSGEREDDARYYLGRLDEQAGNLRAALRSYAAVGRGDHYLDASLRQARLTAELEGLEAARTLYYRMQQDPDEEMARRAYLTEADVLRERGELDMALRQLSRGLIQFPASLDLLYLRGLVYERVDDIAAAEADFRAILEQDPDNVSALNALGYTLADRTDRYEEAHDLIVKAYEQRPDDAAITDSYGWVLYRLGRLDEAVVKLRQAYDLLPDGEIASNLAVVLWELGERDESLAIINEALQREPDHQRLLRVRRELRD
jgi:tetratricopeptide (TPR) repeat protein